MTPPAPLLRRAARLVALTLIAIGALWAIVLLVSGGIDLRIRGISISSHDPLRPFLGFSLGLALLAWVEGPRQALERWKRIGARLDHRVLALLLALAVTISGLTHASTAATGADSYGYVSQSQLWVAGHLQIDQPWVADVPWPNAKWTFSPLGYRPIERDDDWHIVPTYSAGLPLLMAVVQRVAGYCAIFGVVPVFGGLFVLATYGIGRRFGSPLAGLIGAWFVATSPTMWFMLVLPMTDVPVAAAWSAAFYLVLGTGAGAALLGGVCAGLAILIRPNLVFLAAILGAWYLTRAITDRRPGARGRALAHAVLYSAGVLPFAIAVGVINQHLYGSALTSGYGGLGGMFATVHFWPNLKQYAAWLIQTQTPLVLAGVAALALPLRALWPDTPDRRMLVLAGVFAASLWLFYCVYLEFDIWWYLRFLLPSWPFIMIGMGTVAVTLMRSQRPAVILLTIGAIVTLGVVEFRWAASDAMGMWRGERRYVAVAQNVGRRTAENSVVWTMQHSGTIRYYGGRMTARYDLIDRDWIDRAVAWLADRGVHSYLAVDDWEVEEFKKRFAGQQVITKVKEPPLLIHVGESIAYLYDLSGEGVVESGQERIQETYKDLRCAPPAPLPALVLR